MYSNKFITLCSSQEQHPHAQSFYNGTQVLADVQREEFGLDSAIHEHIDNTTDQQEQCRYHRL